MTAPRFALLGNSGSGKSTLAAQLARLLELPALDLDTVAWVPGQVAVPRDVVAAQRDVDAFCCGNAGWIVEGCYGGLISAALRHRPVLVFLEPGVDACLENCRNRPWEPHKYPSKAAQDEQLDFLLQWVAGYYTREGELSLQGHQRTFLDYPGPKILLTARATTEDILELLGTA